MDESNEILTTNTEDQAAGANFAPAPSKPKRTGMPFGIGLTLIIAGSLMVLFGFIGGIKTLVGAYAVDALGGFMSGLPGAGSQIQDAMSSMMEQMRPIAIAQAIMSMAQGAVSIVALVAGVGLVKYKEKGRKLSLMWAVIAMGYIVVSLIVNVAYVLPATEQMTTAMMQQMTQGQAGMPAGSEAMMEGMVGAIGMVTQILSAIVLAVLPVMTLIMMRLPKVVEACRENS